MKRTNFLMMSVAILSILGESCAPASQVVDVVQGKDGKDGANGHSLTSEFVQASELECPGVNGRRLDMYIDMDDSTNPSEGDVYQGGEVICDGSNGMDGATGETGAQGPQGEVGPQGEPGVAGEPGPTGAPGESGEDATATIAVYSSNSCTQITGTTTYTKVGNTNAALYSSSNCHSSSKFAEVSQGESYWAGTKSLAVWAFNQLRVITFN